MYMCIPSSLLLQPLSTQALAMFVTTPQTQIVFGRDSIQLLWSHRNAAIDMAVNASNRQSQQRLVQQVQWMVRLDWNYIILWQHSWELRRGVLAKGNNQSWRYFERYTNCKAALTAPLKQFCGLLVNSLNFFFNDSFGPLNNLKQCGQPMITRWTSFKQIFPRRLIFSTLVSQSHFWAPPTSYPFNIIYIPLNVDINDM